MGNILIDNGDNLIDKKKISKKILFDMISFWELLSYRRFGVFNAIYPLIKPLAIHAARARASTATLENFQDSLEDTDIVGSVCLPIPPYVTFEALRDAAGKDDRVIPFTGIDFNAEKDFEGILKSDVKDGAMGLKLHPNIQKRSYTSSDFFNAVESFAPSTLPVLIHVGSSSYYARKERHRENPAFGGDITSAEKLVKAFPGVRFIAGHAGLYEVNKVIQTLGKHKNVSVDTSFQSPGYIQKLIKSFGPDRVLFGSDWPFGTRRSALKAVKAACRGDGSLEKRITYENAAELLKIQ